MSTDDTALVEIVAALVGAVVGGLLGAWGSWRLLQAQQRLDETRVIAAERRQRVADHVDALLAALDLLDRIASRDGLVQHPEFSARWSEAIADATGHAAFLPPDLEVRTLRAIAVAATGVAPPIGPVDAIRDARAAVLALLKQQPIPDTPPEFNEAWSTVRLISDDGHDQPLEALPAVKRADRAARRAGLPEDPTAEERTSES